MDKNRFDPYEFEAFFGDFVGDYDVEAIVDEVSEVDYRTGNRIWKNISEDELWKICEAHPSRF